MVEEEPENDGNFVIDGAQPHVQEQIDEEHSFESAMVSEPEEQLDQIELSVTEELFEKEPEEEQSFDLSVPEEVKMVEDGGIDFDDVMAADNTDYFKFLEEFANSDDSEAE